MYLVNSKGNKDRPDVITQAGIHIFLYINKRVKLHILKKKNVLTVAEVVP